MFVYSKPLPEKDETHLSNFVSSFCSKEFLPLTEAKKAKNRKKDQKQHKSGDAAGSGNANNMKNKTIGSRYSFNKPLLPPVSKFASVLLSHFANI